MNAYFDQVNLLLYGESLASGLGGLGGKVKEFQVFIHRREGFVNSFMLNGGRPHIIIPGMDPVLQLQKPQQLHYLIK